MLGLWLFILQACLLDASDWDANGDLGGTHDAVQSRPQSRQRRQRAEPTDSIAVDHRAHAARLKVRRRLDIGSSEPTEQVDEEEVKAKQPASQDPGFMRRHILYEEDGDDAEESGLNANPDWAEVRSPLRKDSASDHQPTHADDDAHAFGDYELPDDSDALLQGGDAAQFPWWDRRRRRRRVDCSYKTWSGWKGCSKTCASGTLSRSRGKSGPYHGGRGCGWAETFQAQSCNTNPCPVPCTFSGWSGWTVCSKTCGEGQKTRTRSKNGPYHGGAACNGHTSNTLFCNHFSCPVDCYFQPWSAWGACTKTCIAYGNYGYKTRDRGKVGPFYGGAHCHGHTVDDGLCNQFTCPYDCEVGAWSAWSVCTQTCSVSTFTHGYKIRSRSSVAASNGGKMCAENWQMNHCNTQLCAFDCYFLQWGAWGPCSKTCTTPHSATGIRIRVRDKVGPGMGGKDCHGPVTSTKSCADFNCPIDCTWHSWNDWGACSLSCGVGGRTRTREKNAAQYGGQDCAGSSQHVETCNTWQCPVNCRWSLWDAWMPCTKSCGHGVSHRSRSYDPKPQNGGLHCSGAHMEIQDCMSFPCPVNCEWEEWLDWSLCSKSCGDGIRTKVRLVNITAAFGGYECPHSPQFEEPCPNMPPCPRDCRFSEWADWSVCNSTCGPGRRTTMRELLIAEEGGSEDCPEGELEQLEDCQADRPCPAEIKAAAQPQRSFSLLAFIGLVGGVMSSAAIL